MLRLCLFFPYLSLRMLIKRMLVKKTACISENHANFSFQKTLKEVHFNALIGEGLDEQDSLLLVLVEIEDCLVEGLT